MPHTCSHTHTHLHARTCLHSSKCRRQVAVLRLMPSFLPPGVSGDGHARGCMVLQRLQGREEATLQTDCLGEAGKLQVGREYTATLLLLSFSVWSQQKETFIFIPFVCGRFLVRHSHKKTACRKKKHQLNAQLKSLRDANVHHVVVFFSTPTAQTSEQLLGSVQQICFSLLSKAECGIFL